MPWELTIARADRSPLGDVGTVRQAVADALPGVRFYREPSGAEKMAAVSFEFPEALRRHLASSPATTQADFEGAGFTLRFFLGAGPGVEQMGVEVRGRGDPLSELRHLAEATGWIIMEIGGSRVAP